MLATTAYLLLCSFSMNSRKIRIIFKENFEFQVEFPSVEILLPHLTRKNFVEFLSQRVTEVCNIAKTAGYFLPPCTHPGKKKKSLDTFPKNIHICNSWTEYYKIFQRTFPLCVTLITIYFTFMLGKHLLPKTDHSFKTWK